MTGFRARSSTISADNDECHADNSGESKSETEYVDSPGSLSLSGAQRQSVRVQG